MTTLFIVPGPTSGARDCVFSLVADTGENLYQHLCSDAGYAPGDLILQRPERQVECKARFGEYQVKFIDAPDAGIAEEELIRRNNEWFGKLPVSQTVSEGENR